MIYDIIIVGAGPAGLTAAIYALRSNKKVLVLEKETIGGQMSSSPLIENYPGFLSISGSELANNLYSQVIELGGEVELEEVLSIEFGAVKTVTTDMGKYETKSIIFATGAKYRRLGLEKEEEFIGNGISFCVACDGAFYKDQTVAVIGGGNSAVINAITLSDICKKVYIVQNLDKLSAEASLINKLNEKENVEVIYNATVQELIGDNNLSAISILVDKTEKRKLEIDGIFVSIGLLPQNDFIKDDITLDEYGYIKSDTECTTNLEGVFVAGDCRTKNVRQITTATADGAISAINAVKYLNK